MILNSHACAFFHIHGSFVDRASESLHGPCVMHGERTAAVAKACVVHTHAFLVHTCSFWTHYRVDLFLWPGFGWHVPKSMHLQLLPGTTAPHAMLSPTSSLQLA